MPVLIYFTSLITIVATNLLTGVLVGIGLSLLKLLYTITHLEARVVEDGEHTHVHLSGIGTFLGIPKIAQALDKVRTNGTVRLHSHELRYVDHACIEVIENWAVQREQNGQQVHVSMDQLHARFRTRVSERVG